MRPGIGGVPQPRWLIFPTLVFAILVVLGAPSSASIRGEAAMDKKSHLPGLLPSVTDIKQPFHGLSQLSVTPLPGIPRAQLTRNQVLTVLGHGGVYQKLFASAHGGGGANVAYQVVAGGTLIAQYDALVIKFPSESAGKSFAARYLATLTGPGGAQLWPNNFSTKLGFGVLPLKQRVLYFVPPGPLGSPTGTTTVEQSLYSDGTYFLITGVRPGNSGLADSIVAEYAGDIDNVHKLCVVAPSECP